VSKEATDTLRAALKYLKSEFPSLDSGVFNPSRVDRVPYTMNVKGVDTPERPHRRAKIVSYPDKFEPVNASKLYQLALKAGIQTDDEGRRISTAKKKSRLLIDEDG
jgi:hypothetical protein